MTRDINYYYIKKSQKKETMYHCFVRGWGVEKEGNLYTKTIGFKLDGRLRIKLILNDFVIYLLINFLSKTS